MYRASLLVVFFLGSVAASHAETVFPVGSAPTPVNFPHFPDRMHTFIWRNWTAVEQARLAEVLGTSVENVVAVAESMGLPPQQPIPPEVRTRGYITLLRRNWHLLPYEQMLILLDMPAEQLAQSLSEDDFLFGKMGSLKPKCRPLKYTPPSDEIKKRTAEIKRIVQETFGDELSRRADPRFSFVQKLGSSATRSFSRSSIPFLTDFYNGYLI